MVALILFPFQAQSTKAADQQEEEEEEEEDLFPWMQGNKYSRIPTIACVPTVFKRQKERGKKQREGGGKR